MVFPARVLFFRESLKASHFLFFHLDKIFNYGSDLQTPPELALIIREKSRLEMTEDLFSCVLRRC
jgi:hypothetical protein